MNIRYNIDIEDSDLFDTFTPQMKYVMRFARAIGKPNYNIVPSRSLFLREEGVVNVCLRFETVSDYPYLKNVKAYVDALEFVSGVFETCIVMRVPLKDYVENVCHELAHLANIHRICKVALIPNFYSGLVAKTRCEVKAKDEFDSIDYRQMLSGEELQAFINPHGRRFNRYFKWFLNRAVQEYGAEKIEASSVLDDHEFNLFYLRERDRKLREEGYYFS